MTNSVVNARLLDGTTCSFDTDRHVPWDGPSSGNVPTRIYGDERGRWLLVIPDGYCCEIDPKTAAIRLLTWGYNLPPRLTRAIEAAEEAGPQARPEAPAESIGPEGCVILRGAASSPIVLGEQVPPLTIPQYAVIKVLCNAGGQPVNLSKLMTESRHSDARKILQRAMDSHTLWPKVIHTPGRPRRGYRIAPPAA